MLLILHSDWMTKDVLDKARVEDVCRERDFKPFIKDVGDRIHDENHAQCKKNDLNYAKRRKIRSYRTEIDDEGFGGVEAETGR